MTQEGKRPRASLGDAYRLDLAGRIHRAFKQFNATKSRADEMSQGELGERVAKRLRLAEPFTQGTVSRWMSETNTMTPDVPTLEAIAAVLHCDAAWLVLGDGYAPITAPSGPALPDPTKDRRLTGPEIARAERQAETEERAEARRLGKKRSGRKRPPG